MESPPGIPTGANPRRFALFNEFHDGVLEARSGEALIRCLRLAAAGSKSPSVPLAYRRPAHNASRQSAGGRDRNGRHPLGARRLTPQLPAAKLVGAVLCFQLCRVRLVGEPGQGRGIGVQVSPEKING